MLMMNKLKKIILLHFIRKKALKIEKEVLALRNSKRKDRLQLRILDLKSKLAKL